MGVYKYFRVKEKKTHRSPPTQNLPINSIIFVPTATPSAKNARLLPRIDILIQLINHTLPHIQRPNSITLHLLRRLNHILDLRLKARQHGPVREIPARAVHHEVVGKTWRGHAQVAFGGGRPGVFDVEPVAAEESEVWCPCHVVASCADYYVNFVVGAVPGYEPFGGYACYWGEDAVDVGFD